MNKTKQKTQVTLGDLKELWYMMECPCSFQEFVASYDEDDDFDVINTWVCFNIGVDDIEDDNLDL